MVLQAIHRIPPSLPLTTFPSNHQLKVNPFDPQQQPTPSTYVCAINPDILYTLTHTHTQTHTHTERKRERERERKREKERERERQRE